MGPGSETVGKPLLLQAKQEPPGPDHRVKGGVKGGGQGASRGGREVPGTSKMMLCISGGLEGLKTENVEKPLVLQ